MLACTCWPACLPVRKQQLDNVEHKSLSASCGEVVEYNSKLTLPLAESCNADPLYAWITKDELQKIEAMRHALSPTEREELASAPDHIRHDLMLCRFLRGHSNTVPKAVNALRAHLKFRRHNQAVLKELLASVPGDVEDFDQNLSSMTARFQEIKMLQLPGRHGTNNGMPLSLLVVGHFQLSDIARIRDCDLMDWFLSLVELRCLCLHNQSLREHRMVRVIEMEDCAGFAWSQFIASPVILRKLPGLLQIAVNYPELVGCVVNFNLSPGNIFPNMVLRMLPQAIRDKVMFISRGNWQSCVCVDRGLSPASLVKWSEHLGEFRSNSHTQTLTSTHVQAVRAARLSPGEITVWTVKYKSGPPSAIVKISLIFFNEGSKIPTLTPCCDTHELVMTAGVSTGKFRSPCFGTIFLEVEMQTRTTVNLLIALSSDNLSLPARDDHFSFPERNLPGESVQTSVSRNLLRDQSLLGRAMLSLLFGYLLWWLHALTYRSLWRGVL